MFFLLSNVFIKRKRYVNRLFRYRMGSVLIKSKRKGGFLGRIKYLKRIEVKCYKDLIIDYRIKL